MGQRSQWTDGEQVFVVFAHLVSFACLQFVAFTKRRRQR